MNVSIGFDSCAFPRFAAAVKDVPHHEKLLAMAEGCESFGRFSLYVNVDGRCFPCSFCEGEPGWEQGFDVGTADFVPEVWNSREFGAGREKLLQNGCTCPVFVL
jgi:hypothetical protein